jgi:hypothetical protein
MQKMLAKWNFNKVMVKQEKSYKNNLEQKDQKLKQGFKSYQSNYLIT